MFTDVKARKMPAVKSLHNANQPDDSSNSDVEEETQASKLFLCPEKGCVKSFQTTCHIKPD